MTPEEALLQESKEAIRRAWEMLTDAGEENSHLGWAKVYKAGIILQEILKKLESEAP